MNGTQTARFGDMALPFFFDGAKCFYIVSTITLEEITTLPKVTITPDNGLYNPRDCIYSRRLEKKKGLDIIKWKCHLGFIPDHVVAKTLKATTQCLQLKLKLEI
jgi:hypothetical protein